MPRDHFAPSTATVAPVSLSSPHHHTAQRCRRESPSSPSTRPSNKRHYSILEPSVYRDERPSSPRHHSTANTSSSARATRTHWSPGAQHQYDPPQRYGSPPRDWPADEIALPSLRDDDNPLAALSGWSAIDLNQLYSSDDHFLGDLANNEFSSPSTYPSFTTHQRPPSPGPLPRDRLHQPHPQAATTHTAPTTTSNHPGQSALHTSASTSFDSRSSHSVHSGPVAPHETSQPLPGHDNMPPVTRRRSTSHGVVDHGAPHSATRSHTAKRRRISVVKETRPRRQHESQKRVDLDDDDPFKEPGDTDSPVRADGDAPYMIDLTENNGFPPELSKTSEGPAKEDTRTKLSAFQCAICMDDVTTLTVTHCGHLFCAQCLHSSLHVETTKGRCPMCRAKLDMKPRNEHTTKTKGYYPLELKLMTKTRRGKRKAGALS